MQVAFREQLLDASNLQETFNEKLALDGEHRTDKPLVDANQFLTVAKQWYDLDPPD